MMTEWLERTKAFWTTEANHKRVEELGDGPMRPYPYTYLTPITALSTEGESIVLHPRAKRVTVGCNLAAFVARTGKGIREDEALDYVANYRVLAALKDWFWLDEKTVKSQRDIWAWGANYSRWTDGFNCVSQAAAKTDQLSMPHDARMWVAVDGVGEVVTQAADYLHAVTDILVYVSQTATFREADLIALGRAGEALTIPAERPLPEGAMLRAEIDGIGRLETPIIDRRVFD
jgi:2-keto-4-pentenoate hydratase/2-oxohepta-3-ene-1,7-dioic acid hydratase in catechol pathway